MTVDSGAKLGSAASFSLCGALKLKLKLQKLGVSNAAAGCALRAINNSEEFSPSSEIAWRCSS